MGLRKRIALQGGGDEGRWGYLQPSHPCCSCAISPCDCARNAQSGHSAGTQEGYQGHRSSQQSSCARAACAGEHLTRPS